MNKITEVINSYEPEVAKALALFNEENNTDIPIKAILNYMHSTVGPLMGFPSGEDTVLEILKDESIKTGLIGRAVTSYYEVVFTRSCTETFRKLAEASRDYAETMSSMLGKVIIYAPLTVTAKGDKRIARFDMSKIIGLEAMGDKKDTPAEEAIYAFIFKGLSDNQIPLPADAQITEILKSDKTYRDKYDLVVEGSAKYMESIALVRSMELNEEALKMYTREADKEDAGVIIA